MEEAINLILQGYDMIGQGLDMLQGGGQQAQGQEAAPVDLNAVLAAGGGQGNQGGQGGQER